ncbi:MAG TPA: multidrug efflux SMR transporter [Hyphomicrobiaceae bacterium]|nr:multidrug efflux SMR transporter [Hyphomicrobiaceae bacterium]
MGWIYLLLAGVFEIGFTTSMRYIDWSLRPLPIISFLICSALSFGLLIAAMKSVPLGTAYAVWTGIGAAGTAIIGVAWYGEEAALSRLLFLALLIASIIGLKVVTAQ